MSAHDRYEMLAGAVMLGEATPEERAAFDAHARTCAACASDVAGGTFVRERIAQAHRSETWRPSQPIVERLRARRSVRTRFTLGALGWAVGISLALNVALAGGLGVRLTHAFDWSGSDANVVATTITADAPHVATVTHLAASEVWIKRPARVAHAHRKPQHHGKPVAAAPHAVPSPVESALPTLDDVPDVLAGLDLYGRGAVKHRAVAVETVPRCRPHRDDVPDVRPCRDTAGHIVSF
jgi:anti-sigma factor RsiW